MQSKFQSKDSANGFRVHYWNVKDSVVTEGEFYPEKNSGLSDHERFFDLLEAKREEIPRYSTPERSGITGRDLRTYLGDLNEIYPNSTIAMIVGFYQGDYFTSTGFLIDKKFLLTAGHAVKENVIAEELFILLGAEKDKLPYGVLRPSDVFILRRDSNINKKPREDLAYDLALIKLESEAPMNNFLMLQEDLLKTLSYASNISEIHARITGYDVIRISNDDKLVF